MKPLLSLLLALLSAVCCLGAQLSTDTLSSPATIDSLQARIDRLERRADRWDRLRSRLPEFSGYVQLGYEYDGNTSSFLIRRAQFALAGSLLPSLHYNVRLEFASPQILDAYLDYCPLQALNLRSGNSRPLFDREYGLSADEDRVHPLSVGSVADDGIYRFVRTLLYGSRHGPRPPRFLFPA